MIARIRAPLTSVASGVLVWFLLPLRCHPAGETQDRVLRYVDDVAHHRGRDCGARAEGAEASGARGQVLAAERLRRPSGLPTPPTSLQMLRLGLVGPGRSPTGNRDMESVAFDLRNICALLSADETGYLAEGLNKRAAVSSIADALALRLERAAKDACGSMSVDEDEQFELELLLGRADLTGELTEGLHAMLEAIRARPSPS